VPAEQDGPQDGPEDPQVAGYFHDGASYVDAATVALRYASVELGKAPASPPVRPPSSPVTPRQLRDAMGTLVTGVCVVTTIADGEDVAMTANSVTSVSLEPPLILVCVAHSARFHGAITRAEHWGVSVLDAHSAEISSMFARPGKDKSRGFDDLVHHRGEVTGVALIDASCAFLECRTEHVYPGGDHSIVIGRVLATEVRSEPVAPLVFHQGAYRWLR
jgi:flavin reductase (DIM6/NTAB) family NADH-FMN oxidoreductase RutF